MQPAKTPLARGTSARRRLGSRRLRRKCGRRMTVWKSSSKKQRKPTKPPELDAADLLTLLDERDLALAQAQRDTAVRLFGDSPGVNEVLAVTQSALELGERVRLRIVSDSADESAKFACGKGCHWCCHYKVAVTIPEVLTIATYLRNFVSDDGVRQVRERVAHLAQDRRIFSVSEKPKARIACALLLKDGSCGVYPVRPLSCRGVNSTDVHACERSLDDSSVGATSEFAMVKAFGAVQLGLIKAMDERNLRPYTVELTAGLDVALNEPQALERWLGGEPTFERASGDIV
jgi:Fe-S-cluster containining protein